MQTLFSIILPSWPFAFFLIRFLLCTSRLPILIHSLPPPSTPISQSHTGIFTRLHSPFIIIITIPSTRRQLSSKYCFHSSSFWRCRNCYEYSLPPCYITPSAVPIYQTECCPVYYTCDLSRLTDFAGCRLIAQLQHTFALSSGDR